MIYPWEVEEALSRPQRKAIKHRADLTDEQIEQELVSRSLKAGRPE